MSECRPTRRLRAVTPDGDRQRLAHETITVNKRRRAMPHAVSKASNDGPLGTRGTSTACVSRSGSSLHQTVQAAADVRSTFMSVLFTPNHRGVRRIFDHAMACAQLYTDLALSASRSTAIRHEPRRPRWSPAQGDPDPAHEPFERSSWGCHKDERTTVARFSSGEPPRNQSVTAKKPVLSTALSTKTGDNPTRRAGLRSGSESGLGCLSDPIML